MVGPKPLLELCAASDAANVPRRKVRENVAFGVGEIIHRRTSIIAQTSEKREGRVKSGEVLDLMYTLYRETGPFSMFKMSSNCKVIIVGHKAQQWTQRKDNKILFRSKVPR